MENDRYVSMNEAIELTGMTRRQITLRMDKRMIRYEEILGKRRPHLGDLLDLKQPKRYAAISPMPVERRNAG